MTDRLSTESALDAANVALQGKRARDTRRLTAIELRQVDSQRAAFELAMAAGAGVVTLGLMLVLLLY
jgi:hypothetical protein